MSPGNTFVPDFLFIILGKITSHENHIWLHPAALATSQNPWSMSAILWMFRKPFHYNMQVKWCRVEIRWHFYSWRWTVYCEFPERYLYVVIRWPDESSVRRCLIRYFYLVNLILVTLMSRWRLATDFVLENTPWTSPIYASSDSITTFENLFHGVKGHVNFGKREGGGVDLRNAW